MADDVDEDRDVEIVENVKCDPRLDFFSDKFDPLLALRTPGVEVLDTTAKVFDNLAAYKVFTDNQANPRKDVRKKVNNKDAEGTVVQRRWLEHQMPVKSQHVKKSKNLWTRMKEAQGPLSLLQRCIQEKLRIKVWTRDDRRIRGYCLAYLVAFDRYWNMALEDVTEVWNRPKKRKIPAFDSVVKSTEHAKIRARVKPPKISITPHATDKKLETCTRFVPQLMIRGEHVVFVNIIKEENDGKVESKKC